MTQLQRARKLTEEQVREIRENEILSTALAKHYGVSAKVIRDIRSGRHYKHVTTQEKTNERN